MIYSYYDALGFNGIIVDERNGKYITYTFKHHRTFSSFRTAERFLFEGGYRFSEPPKVTYKRLKECHRAAEHRLEVMQWAAEHSALTEDRDIKAVSKAQEVKTTCEDLIQLLDADTEPDPTTYQMVIINLKGIEAYLDNTAYGNEKSPTLKEHLKRRI